MCAMAGISSLERRPRELQIEVHDERRVQSRGTLTMAQRAQSRVLFVYCTPQSRYYLNTWRSRVSLVLASAVRLASCRDMELESILGWQVQHSAEILSWNPFKGGRGREEKAFVNCSQYFIPKLCSLPLDRCNRLVRQCTDQSKHLMIRFNRTPGSWFATLVHVVSVRSVRL